MRVTVSGFDSGVCVVAMLSVIGIVSDNVILIVWEIDNVVIVIAIVILSILS